LDIYCLSHLKIILYSRQNVSNYRLPNRLSLNANEYWTPKLLNTSVLCSRFSKSEDPFQNEVIKRMPILDIKKVYRTSLYLMDDFSSANKLRTTECGTSFL